MPRRCFAIAALLAVLATAAFAQAPAADPAKPQPGSISGHVSLDGQPAGGVTVRQPRAE
jgi:hypothetical protein